MNINTFGTLYIVATPIGNMNDITFRAIETLKAVDTIAAEDTRHSVALLKHYGISKPLLALHEHNERQNTENILKKLQTGESIALISDAGTPLINDPGYYLVHEARNLGIKIVPIPGPCAAIAAICASGLPTDRFSFEGFLSAKKPARLARLKTLVSEDRTMIFYEAPHRILDLLDSLQEVFGEKRKIVIARELTKLFETIHSGTVAEIISWMKADTNQQKGEMVVSVAGADKTESLTDTISSDTVLKLLIDELPLKKAAEITSKITGKRKNELYERALELKKFK